jgi:hypothetical protein
LTILVSRNDWTWPKAHSGGLDGEPPELSQGPPELAVDYSGDATMPIKTEVVAKLIFNPPTAGTAEHRLA